METSATNPSLELAEVQGLYGPFCFPERLLQRIWMRREFVTTPARTECGLHVQVLHPGRWNQLGGPDFKNARLLLNGIEVTGDVELHLHAADWKRHGHHRDHAYDQVILHAALWSSPEARTERSDGRMVPLLILLPMLLYSLEDYAADAAVETLANRAATRATEELLSYPMTKRLDVLHRHATARWDQKVRFLRVRAERLGWTEACHQTALEILGYRFNRAPMLRIAQRWPLEAWQHEPSPADEAFSSETGRWSLQGVRPANHPKTRLCQYAQWVQTAPVWPELCSRTEALHHFPLLLASDLHDMPARTSREFRTNADLVDLRAHMADTWCGRALVGPRLDTLICNLLLPALSIRANAHGAPRFWYHWYAGDLPQILRQSLRDLDVLSHAQPICHGLAQGLLGWWIEHERNLMKM